MVIDGTNFLMRTLVKVPNKNINRTLLFLRQLEYVVKLFNPQEIFMVFDGIKGNLKRRMILPQYKIGRTPILQDKKQLNEVFINILNILDSIPIITLRIDGVQADDVIAHIIKQRKEKLDMVIVSSDKDFLQLVQGQNVIVWSPIKKKKYKQNVVIEQFGIHPRNFNIYKCLVGDGSDNIRGVKGFGHKTVIKLYGDILKQKQPLNGDVNTFLSYIKEHYNSVNKEYQPLRNIEYFKNMYKVINLQGGMMISPHQGIQLISIIKNKRDNLQFNKKEFIKQLYEQNINMRQNNTFLLPLMALFNRWYRGKKQR